MKDEVQGLSFTGALTILFIGLKLGKVIDWRWFWVLSPTLLSIFVGIIIGIFISISKGE